MMRAFVVDDEPLAVRRLKRMLEETGRVEVAGASSDPVDALAALAETAVDVLFLDIQMPGMTGFEMLGMMDRQPLVVFTTAYDQYALRAFEVNSIDYLLKPIEERHLARALDKIERLRASAAAPPDWKAMLAQLAGAGPPHDFRAELERLSRDRNLPRPQYQLLGEAGPGHARTFRVEVRIGREIAVAGEGPSKKAAAHHAAQEVCRMLRDKLPEPGHPL